MKYSLKNHLRPPPASNLTLKVTGIAAIQIGKYFQDIWHQATGKTIDISTNARKIINKEENIPTRIIFRNMQKYHAGLRDIIFAAINNAQE